ncbi:anthrone oxygenase family protein [[Mycobacterium] crassicus]|uniref:Anthrone oxygenase family protein n=1 Tax=[Mycobacterium] crassicus TaxID=2872309 RepID=A0ABU5XGU8_9MYCO|nr:anthrone oxygenase family protein [Mycolicibacter sp. MYC098]MEB3021421.1 anthrone oxygenase family protein [Mycolicibacter sp. MYC098]
MTEIVEILALLVVGALVGSEFAVAAFVRPILGRLPDDAFWAARGDGAGLLGKVMPFWYLTSFALLVAVGVVADSQRWLIGVGAGVMVAVVLLSVLVLVPINNKIAAWRTPDDVSRALAARWDRLHWLRVVMLAVIYVLLVIGVVNA